MHHLKLALNEIKRMEEKARELREEIAQKEQTIRHLKQHHDKRVRFDEETIAEHDKERGTRMKIDEPKTPYVRDGKAFAFPETVDEEMPGLDERNTLLGEISATRAAVRGDKQSRSDSDDASDVEHEELELQMELPQEETLASRRPPVKLSVDVSTDPDPQTKKSDFEAARKQHYNEYQRLKQLREANIDEDDDAEEDEKASS